MATNHYRYLGVRDDDALGQQMAQQFLRDAQQHGLSKQQAERVVQVCARNEQTWVGMDPQAAIQQFEEQTSNMLSDSDYDYSFQWLGDFKPGAAEPGAAERSSRLKELDEMSRDASGEYYTGAEAEALQREHLQLLEAGEITDAQFEQAASQASEQLDEGSNAFDNNAAEGAADYGAMTNDE